MLVCVQIASASPYRYKKCFGTFFYFPHKKTRPNGLVSLYEYIKLDRDKSTFKSHRDFSSEIEITFKHFQGLLLYLFCYSIFRRDWT